MTTSGGIMQKVTPEIFDIVNQAGSVESLMNAENLLKEQCARLNNINAG